MQTGTSWGLIQLFTGNGKGKTTAALGTALRAAANGKRVAILFFDKGGDSHYSERMLLKKIPGIDIFPTGLDRIDPVTKKFRFGVSDADRTEGNRGLLILASLFEQRLHDLIVLDEINSSTSLGMVDEHDVLNLLAQRPPHIELILTGRNAPKSFIDAADLVSDIQLVKHYFYRGIPAREGLDY
ncbi:MAG TPA: cob(I)yrinic acid a,c-diamide adenosyltransferase [Patescibacteria group bacterium]|nr:cob(I)yrinic acid a,c-diamide adenosyltransferase [Patescibacteria group bacterium]